MREKRLITEADPDLEISGGGGGHPDPAIRGGGGSHPDPAIRGGGGGHPGRIRIRIRKGAGLKKFFSALRASVWSQIRGSPPLDPPLD